MEEWRAISRLLLDSGRYALGGFAYKALALFTLPILARLLIPTELGMLDVAALTGTTLAVIIGVGSDNAIARFVQDDPERTWASAIAIVVALAVGAVGLAAVAEGLGAGTAIGGPPGIVLAAGAYGAAAAGLGLGLNAVRLGPGSRTYFRAAFAVLVMESAGALAIATQISEPIVWIIVAWAVISGAAGTILVIRFAPPLRARPTLAAIKRLVTFGIPFVPGVLAWMLGDLLIRALIGGRLGPAELGLYSIGHRLANLIPLIAIGFGLAWHPLLYASSLSQRDRLLPLVAVLATGALVSIALGLSMLAPELVALFGGSQYSRGAGVVGPLSLGFVCFGVVTLLAPIAGLNLQTGRIALASLVGLLIQGVAAFNTIPALGIVGGAAAAALGFIAAMAIMSPVARRSGLSRGQVISIAVMLSGLALLIATVTLMGAVSLWLRCLLLAAGVAAVLLLSIGATRSRSHSLT